MEILDEKILTILNSVLFSLLSFFTQNLFQLRFSQYLMVKPRIRNSKAFYILSTKFNMSVVEKEIIFPAVTFKRQT